MKSISIGIEDFKKAIENSYYVDKSQFIAHALDNEVTLFTRPRRFGKTLNMSMLRYFIDIREKDNAYLFNGLKITQDKEMMKFQNQYPVISLSLKWMKKNSFEDAIEKFAEILSDYVQNHEYLFESDKITSVDKKIAKKYEMMETSKNELEASLKRLSRMLYRFYDKQVLVLIDEYDVPLQAAYENGYYDEMTDFLKSFFDGGLKTNDYLFKGVLIGCLRISKESIFTGLNNLKVRSIFDSLSSCDFGFTQEEVDDMLAYYDLEDKKEEVRRWFEGYRFGKSDIYNPWSVLNYVDDHMEDRDMKPESYWANSSDNRIIYDYIQKGNEELRDDFERLMKGGTVIKPIIQELTYREMDDMRNIYSFLLLTGYLKAVNEAGNEYELMIPNSEVREIYRKQFDEWFDKEETRYGSKLMKALLAGDEEAATKLITAFLSNTVSYYDESENGYHMLLLGLLGKRQGAV